MGRDPEIRAMQDGREVANLALATSESWKDKNTGERKEKTEWHRIAIFNDGLVNVVKNYVKKGSKLYIEGQLQTRKWTNKEGQEQYTTEVVLQGYGGNLTMLDSKGASGGGMSDNGGGGYNQAPSFGQVPQQQAAAAPALDDEIPF